MASSAVLPVPPSPSVSDQIQSPASHDLEAHLDSQILHIRKEIAKLRAQKQRLSSSLLGSNRVQKQLFTRKYSKQNGAPTPEDDVLNAKLDELESKIEQEKDVNDIKIHRLAFGVTSFPFSDHAPGGQDRQSQSQTMLGVRFDLHPTRHELEQKNGENNDEHEDDDAEVNTYFLILRKLVHDGCLYLKVHQHSIPAHIDIDGLEQKYLPLPEALQSNSPEHASLDDTPSFNDDSGIDLTLDVVQPDTNDASPVAAVSRTNSLESTGQDLHAFARTVHAHLRAWQYRMQSVYLVRREIETRPELGVQDIRCTNDGRQVTVAWKIESLALLKVGFDGIIETVVAYGGAERDDGEEGREVESVRLFGVERKLSRTETGEKVRISELMKRLEAVQEYFDSL